MHLFQKVSVCSSGGLDASADESAAVCFQGGGALSSMKHLNQNSQGEEESSPIAVKYRSLLPPYRINI